MSEQEPTQTYEFTAAEVEMLLRGLAYVNAYFGPPPDPPTPGMTAAAKLEASSDPGAPDA